MNVAHISIDSDDYYNLPDVVTGATPGRKSSESRKSSAADNKAYIQSNKHKKSEYILAYKPSINEGSAHQRVAVVTSTYSDFDDSDEGQQKPPAAATAETASSWSWLALDLALAAAFILRLGWLSDRTEKLLDDLTGEEGIDLSMSCDSVMENN